MLEETVKVLSDAAQVERHDMPVFFPEGIQLIDVKFTFGATTISVTVRGDKAKSGGGLTAEGIA